VAVLSLQPNQPSVWHVVLLLCVLVTVGDGGLTIGGSGSVVGTGGVGISTVLSLHPNHPGVRHVEGFVVVVVIVIVVVLLFVDFVVVVSSRQPHQPGVLQVMVRVAVEEDVLSVEVVVIYEKLLSKYSQL